MGLMQTLNRLDDAAGVSRGSARGRQWMIDHSAGVAVAYVLLTAVTIVLVDAGSLSVLILMFPMFQAGYFYNERCRRDRRYPRWDRPRPVEDERSGAF
jgi:Flp pilus assembly protein TadB